jgi:hypothetical protein
LAEMCPALRRVEIVELVELVQKLLQPI